MRILQVSTIAQLAGAGIAAYRLQQGLRCLGADAWMLVNRQRSADPYVVTPAAKTDKLLARLAPLLDRLPGQLSGLDMDRVSASWVPDRLVHRVSAVAPDILNLHWVNDGFMRIETLPRLRQPVVWTLHDMWAFSGGEHYVGDSRRYIDGYTAANRPPRESGVDVHRWIWRRKRKAWAGLEDRVVIAAPSRWMADCARQSALFRDFRVEVLPNGIDHERFHPVEHAVARRILGLPEDRKLILFGAGSATSDRRKGFHLLVEALQKLEARVNPAAYELVVFGASAGDNPCTMKTHYLGRLEDEISMALVYAAADVFVAPSLEDNLPNTVLESLACGTPVVAFDTGGIPDMVEHEVNGYLAACFDVDDLANGLVRVLEDNERWRQLADAGRRKVVRQFTLQASARNYLGLYEELLKGR